MIWYICSSSATIPYHTTALISLEMKIKRTRRADSTKQNSVMLLQALEPAVGDVFSGFLVGFRTPVVVFEGQGEGSRGFGEDFEDFDAGVDYFGADAVGGDAGDAVCGFCYCAERHCEGVPGGGGFFLWEHCGIATFATRGKLLNSLPSVCVYEKKWK